jgi:hypothetical protein
VYLEKKCSEMKDRKIKKVLSRDGYQREEGR